MFITLITAYAYGTNGEHTKAVGFTARSLSRAEEMTQKYALSPVTLDEAEEWIKNTGNTSDAHYVFVEAANDDGGRWVNMTTGAPALREYAAQQEFDEWLDDNHPMVIIPAGFTTHTVNPSRALRDLDTIAYTEAFSHYTYTFGIEVIEWG